MNLRHLHFEPSYRSLVDKFSKPVAVYDENLQLIYFNNLYETLVSPSAQTFNDLIKSPTQIAPTTLIAHIQQKGYWLSQLNEHFTDGQKYQIKLLQLPNTEKPRFVGVFDTQRLELLKTQTHRSQVDDLTGLPNRYAFSEALTSRVRQAADSPDFAVLYIDLDHFRDINELHGHEIGDGLLKLCAEKIRQLLRKDDLLARLSGDEFAAIVDCKESHEMQYLCHRIMRYFERPVSMDGQHYQFTVSIGVVFYPEQGDCAQDLVINAEKAMFAAKKGGRAQFQLFDRKQSQKVEKQQRIAECLRRVLSNEPEQFRAVYQPLYQLQTGRFVGVEVLARWHSPEFGEVSPVDFIGLAESRGLINALTARMFSNIERDILMTKPALNGERPLLAVNVSAQQIGDPIFEAQLKQFHQTVNASGWQLEVELTESQLMTLCDTLIEQLDMWRTQGIRIAIDDFGTGYSCLAYLHMLPVDKLKIDRQFLQTKTEDKKEDQIMYAIMSMAKALDIEVLAEGIETPEQFERLQQLGCMVGQGFGLARPQPWHPKLLRALEKH